jgi:predicted acylesterase/phospholipase RssA
VAARWERSSSALIEWLLDNRIEPDVVSGVSIGAINAAVLCGHRHPDPKVALRDLWASLTTPSLPPPLDPLNERLSMFGNAGMYLPRTDYLNILNWTSFYDTRPLRSTLERLVSFEKLGPANFQRSRPAPRLVLTATNLRSGRLDQFDSRRCSSPPPTCWPAGACRPAFRRPWPPRRRTGGAASSRTGTEGSSTTPPCPR